jgi:hypothetical protein
MQSKRSHITAAGTPDLLAIERFLKHTHGTGRASWQGE